jgi:hypothetical protein
MCALRRGSSLFLKRFYLRQLILILLIVFGSCKQQEHAANEMSPANEIIDEDIMTPVYNPENNEYVEDEEIILDVILSSEIKANEVMLIEKKYELVTYTASDELARSYL